MRHSKLAPFAARVASHDSVLGGHKVPKNVSCYYISMPVLLILLMCQFNILPGYNHYYIL